MMFESIIFVFDFFDLLLLIAPYTTHAKHNGRKDGKHGVHKIVTMGRLSQKLFAFFLLTASVYVLSIDATELTLV